MLRTSAKNAARNSRVVRPRISRKFASSAKKDRQRLQSFCKTLGVGESLFSISLTCLRPELWRRRRGHTSKGGQVARMAGWFDIEQWYEGEANEGHDRAQPCDRCRNDVKQGDE
jgi:murein endopeptidase